MKVYVRHGKVVIGEKRRKYPQFEKKKDESTRNEPIGRLAQYEHNNYQNDLLFVGQVCVDIPMESSFPLLVQKPTIDGVYQ